MADEMNAVAEDVIGQPELAAEDTAQAELTEVEQLAVEMGWKPESEYSGDKAKWKPAKDWIKVERDINRDLKNDVRGLREQVNRMASAATKQTERALRQQAEEFTRQFNEAVENKDAHGAATAAQGLRDLEESARSETNNSEADFARNNSWYGTDDAATAYAISISQREAKAGKSHADQLSAVEREVRKRFPELFGESGQTKQPAAVHAPQRSVSKPKVKGFSELPAPVKDAAERYAKLFHDKHGIDPEKTKANYAKDYWATQQAA